MHRGDGHWTQEAALRLRYRADFDPRGSGNHYIWEGGTGFGMRVYRSGRRTWVCGSSILDPGSGKSRARFFTLGVIGQKSLKDARIAANKKLDAMRVGVDPRSDEKTSKSQAGDGEIQLAETSLGNAIDFYVKNRNCAPRSKSSLISSLQNLDDWMSTPFLRIDSVMLQKRYHKVIARVRAEGEEWDTRCAELSAEERLLRAAPGYRTGIKAALDTVKCFGRVFKYWVKMHKAQLQRAQIPIPDCPTLALADDLIPEPQRVKSVPLADLRKLIASFPSYSGNKLHPLLARFLLATGLRVGITMCCKPQYLKGDRIEIPASTTNSKVRWNKRHLSHLAKIIPRTPEINQILKEIEIVAPEYGKAEEWLFPSLTAESGHMEEEKAPTLGLRAHAGVRFTVHQFRHNVATAAEELGYSKAEIKELLGQATGDVTDRYIDERVRRHLAQLTAINEQLSQSLDQSRATKQPISKLQTSRRKSRGRNGGQPGQGSLPGF